MKGTVSKRPRKGDKPSWVYYSSPVMTKTANGFSQPNQGLQQNGTPKKGSARPFSIFKRRRPWRPLQKFPLSLRSLGSDAATRGPQMCAKDD